MNINFYLISCINSLQTPMLRYNCFDVNSCFTTEIQNDVINLNARVPKLNK